MYNFCNHCMSQFETEITQCPVCGKSNDCKVPAHRLLPGTILNARFYVGVALGEGGFGITYIGYDMKLDMKVAIKEFYPNGFVNRNNTNTQFIDYSVTDGSKAFFEKGKERFLDEAKMLAKFSGESGIVDVRDFFEENNTAYIVMEYLDGIDLKTFLRENGTMAPESLLQLLMPVMNSLKKVHAQGLIHRDISPDNIMIVGNNVKLLDFGAARSVSLATNKSLSVMIKPGFAPEEQYRSKGEQGPWTDVYALCATMYKCITGITPDDATQRVYSDEVKAPSALNVAIRPEFERAIMKGMSVRQSDRYQNIDELIMGIQGLDVGGYGYMPNTVVNNASNNIPNSYSNNVPNNMPNNYPNNIPNNGAQTYALNSSAPDSNGQKNKSKSGLIAIIAVVAFIIVAIIAVIAMSGGNDTDTAITAGASTSSQSQQDSEENKEISEDASENTDKTEDENAGAVPATNGEIAAAYNKAVNDFKAYTGKVTLKKHDIINVQLKDLPVVAEKVITPVITKLTTTSPEEFTFENGVDANDPNRKITDKIIPGGRNAEVSESGLANATATANADGGYTMTLTFIAESSNFDGVQNTSEPVEHMKAMDPLNLGALDLGPVTISHAALSYPGATLTATVDDQGKLVKLEQNLPISGQCTGKAGIELTLALGGSMDGTYEMTYA